MTPKAVSNSDLLFGVVGVSKSEFSVRQLPGVRQRQALHHTSGSVRRFTNSIVRQGEDNARNEPQGDVEGLWISVLENTANAPWLFSLPDKPESRLTKTHILLLQIVMYLLRPNELDKATHHFALFRTAIVPPDSEIGRARRAVAVLTRAIVFHMSSIPENSPLRQEHAELFEISGALQPLHDVYLANGDPDAQEWIDFWSRAEPVLIALGEKLSESGFGVDPEAPEK